jgi:hypothetical protein
MGYAVPDLTANVRLPDTGSMINLATEHEIEKVCAGLSRAWHFLSGAERQFMFSMEQQVALACAEFSYFMPMEVAHQQAGGIGVLMQRSDAQTIAAHMFGADASALAEPDLHDACAEACNVFSDCVALHIGGHSDVHIGLPFLAGPAEYAQIASQSIPAAIYSGCSLHAPLYVVVYHFFSQPH